ncbi:MAG: VOC family protein [Actinomycetota bacterium]|nr:VOC family protein [Actinomycetota bacterium]
MSLDGIQLVFDSVDPLQLSHFWSEVTGYRRAVHQDDYISLDGGGLGVAQFVFVEVPEWKTAVNRVRPDLVVADLESELARVVGLGATVSEVGELAGGRIAILRDPEGNEFTLHEQRAAAA